MINFILLAIIMSNPQISFAQVQGKDLGPIDFGTNFGKFLQNPGFVTQGYFIGQLATILTNTFSVITVTAFIWFIFQFLFGAYKILGSGGDKNGMQAGQQQITQAVTGLVLMVAAFAIMSVLGKILGIEIFNLQNLLNNLGPVPPAVTPTPWPCVPGQPC